jgi:hypothetical protein
MPAEMISRRVLFRDGLNAITLVKWAGVLDIKMTRQAAEETSAPPGLTFAQALHSCAASARID